MTAIGDRLPPQNLEAEISVLGSCLLDRDVIDDVLLILRGSDFYRTNHQAAFEGIVELHRAGKGVDAITLADHLIAKDQFAKIGGDDFLRKLCDSVPHAANAAYYAGIVREKSIARQLIEGATEIIREGYANQNTAQELLSSAERKIGGIAEREVKGKVLWLRESIDRGMARLMQRQQDGITGLSTGFEDLDLVTGGFKPGELTILAARPSMGKSALATEFLLRIAKMKTPALFISLEMGEESLNDRMISCLARVDGYKFQRSWMLNEQEKRDIHNAANQLMQWPLAIDYTSSRTVQEIAALARRMKRSKGLGIVAVDYLQYVRSGERGRSREEDVASISRDLKEMARSLEVPVLILSQLNRQCEMRPDKKPTLADLRESGQIEQDADVAILLFRPEVYFPDKDIGIAELNVAKNRNGRTGTVKLRFTKQFTAFDSLETHESDPNPPVF